MSFNNIIPAALLDDEDFMDKLMVAFGYKEPDGPFGISGERMKRVKEIAAMTDDPDGATEAIVDLIAACKEDAVPQEFDPYAKQSEIVSNGLDKPKGLPIL